MKQTSKKSKIKTMQCRLCGKNTPTHEDSTCKKCRPYEFRKVFVSEREAMENLVSEAYHGCQDFMD